jgi:RimJ/RimL family protein N-acetyltransferase
MRSRTTNRLTLEPLEPTHAEALFEGLQDERLYKWIEERPPESIEALRHRYERLQTRRSADGQETWLNWAIRLGTSEEYIGYVQATIRQHDALLAYVLFADAWGKGLGQEAVHAMMNELIEFYDVSTINAIADERNRRSVNLLLSLGFRKCSDVNNKGANKDVRFTRTGKKRHFWK